MPNNHPFKEPIASDANAPFPTVIFETVVEPSVVDPLDVRFVNEPVPPTNAFAFEVDALDVEAYEVVK